MIRTPNDQRVALLPIDLSELQSAIATEVIAQLRPLLSLTHVERTVSREAMAKLLNISLPSLDRLVATKRQFQVCKLASGAYFYQALFINHSRKTLTVPMHCR